MPWTSYCCIPCFILFYPQCSLNLGEGAQTLLRDRSWWLLEDHIYSDGDQTKPNQLHRRQASYPLDHCCASIFPLLCLLPFPFLPLNIAEYALLYRNLLLKSSSTFGMVNLRFSWVTWIYFQNTPHSSYLNQVIFLWASLTQHSQFLLFPLRYFPLSFFLLDVLSLLWISMLDHFRNQFCITFASLLTYLLRWPQLY